MKLETKKQGRVMVVKIFDQRLEALIAKDFKEEMANLINQGNKLFVLDISEVNFIDSTGLGAIISSLKLAGKDGNIAISGTKESLMSMFKLTRMNKVFQMFDNEKDAVEALSV